MKEQLSRKPFVLNTGFHPPPPGGMANFIVALEKSSLRDYYSLTGFDTDHTKWMRKFRPLALLYLPILYLRYWFTLTASRPEAVHLHTPAFKSFYKHCIFLGMAHSKNIPVVMHIHAGKFREFFENLNRKHQQDVIKKLSEADLLIVLSQYWFEFFSNLIPSEKIRIVENGIPLHLFKKPADVNSKTGKRFLFVGRIHPEKGMDELIDAFSQILQIHPDAELRIVGGEKVARFDKQEIYLNKCSGLGISERVIFTGQLTGIDLVKQYFESDVFVLPSHAEGMPLVLLEAMASSLPCIATSVGAIPEVLNSTAIPGGFIIPPRNADALKDKMLYLLENPDKHQAMGAENRKIVESRFSFDIVAEKIRRIYDELVIKT
jgi:glycosyltransferase involved in cell wall biosynthesis